MSSQQAFYCLYLFSNVDFIANFEDYQINSSFFTVLRMFISFFEDFWVEVEFFLLTDIDF